MITAIKMRSEGAQTMVVVVVGSGEILEMILQVEITGFPTI